MDATEVVIVEGTREDIVVTMRIEDVGGGADVFENVKLDVNVGEMVAELVVAMVILGKCEPNSEQKIDSNVYDRRRRCRPGKCVPGARCLRMCFWVRRRYGMLAYRMV